MAVYTDVGFEDLKALLVYYDIGEPHIFKGIAEGVENSNYYLRTARGAFILTLYEKRVQAGDLPFFLGLMEHLARQGIRCPMPVRGHDGAVSRTLKGRPAAILSFLDGVSLSRPTPVHCGQAGRALAALHHASSDFRLRRDNTLGLAGWCKLAATVAPKADGVMPGMGALITSEIEFLTGAWPAVLPQGVIHADLFPDNVLFVGNTVSGLIDFYFACNDALAYDLAVMLNAWAFDGNNTFNTANAGALVAGYRELRPLAPAERAAFPILARGAALRFLLTRLYDWVNQSPGALVRPKDPREFAARLQFHRRVSSIDDYS